MSLAILACPKAADPLPLQAATQKLWTIRALVRSGDMDLHAATVSLSLLADHPEARVSRLALESLHMVEEQLIGRAPGERQALHRRFGREAESGFGVARSAGSSHVSMEEGEIVR